MGTKNKPAPFDAYASAENDEPLFTLLARDVHAPFLLRAWADIREANGEAPSKVEEARACADAMARWNERNRGRKPLDAPTVFELFRRGPTAGSLGLDTHRAELVSDEEYGDLGAPLHFDWEKDDLPLSAPPAPTAPPARPAARPAAHAPILDVPGVPSPGGAAGEAAGGAGVAGKAVASGSADRAAGTAGSAAPVILGDVMTVPPGMEAQAAGIDAEPQSETGVTVERGAVVGSSGVPAPQRGPQAARPEEKMVAFRQILTLGIPSEFSLRLAPEFVFQALNATTNAPGLGFVTLLEWQMGNAYILYDPKKNDFFTPDVYEYCVKGMGKTGIKTPPISPNHAIKLTMRYTGAVPDGSGFGEAFLFEFVVRGHGLDRAML